MYSVNSIHQSQSDSSTEDKIIAQHLDELSLHLEQERVAQSLPPGLRSRTNSQLSEGSGPPFPPLQVPASTIFSASRGTFPIFGTPLVSSSITQIAFLSPANFHCFAFLTD